MMKFLVRSLCLLLSHFILACALFAESPRVPLPSSVFFEQPLAMVEGGAAVWMNPASLAFSRANEFMIMGTLRDGSTFDDWGTVSRFGFAGGATRRLFDVQGSDASEYVLGVGLPIQTQGGLGFGYRHFSSGPDALNHRHQWSAGFAWRSGRSLSFAAILNNLNRGRLNGVRTQVEHHYSIGLRPENEWLTFAVDMQVGSGQRFGDALWSYEAEIQPRRGTAIEISYRSDDTWQIGLRFNLAKQFFGSRSTLDRKGKHQQSILYAGITSAIQPTLLPSRRSALLMSTATPGEADQRSTFGPTQSGFARKGMALARAARDPKIDAIYLLVDGLSFSQAFELREELALARKNGKRVACYLGRRSSVAYYLASVADLIAMPPATALELTGLKAELSFYAETLRKLGLEADLIAVGQYKSAVEPFTRDSASPYYRIQIDHYLDSLMAELTRGIAEGRHLSVDSVMQLIDMAPFPSGLVTEYGLVDTLIHREQFVRMAERAGAISLAAYEENRPKSERWDSPPKIAVVVAEGEVLTDNSGSLGSSSPSLQPASFKQAIDQAVSDPSVAGIVVRVNSPGGISSAGELIRYRASEAAKKKPLWISMSSLAASAGYDLATAGSLIYANPLTITGSIGIFGGKVSMAGLHEKIGVSKELITRGKNAGINSTSRPFTDSEREAYRRYLDQSYKEFVTTVAVSRNLSEDSVQSLAQGRIFTGREAVTNGLADRVGSLALAVADMADSLGLQDFETLFVKRRLSLWSSLRLPEIPGIFGSLLAGKLLSGSSRTRSTEDQSDLDEQTFARLPFDIEVE